MLEDALAWWLSLLSTLPSQPSQLMSLFIFEIEHIDKHKN